MAETKAKRTKRVVKTEEKVERRKLSTAVWEMPDNADLVAQVLYI